jgi:hypothetical protein
VKTYNAKQYTINAAIPAWQADKACKQAKKQAKQQRQQRACKRQQWEAIG